MKTQCPRCKHIICASDTNIQENVVYCTMCKEIFDARACLDFDFFDEDILRNPPKGIWRKEENDNTVIRATILFPLILNVIPLMITWFLPFFLWIFLFGKYEPGNVTVVLFAVFLAAISITFMFIFARYGKYEIQSDSNNLSFFMGIGKYGFKRSVPLNKIQFIREENRFFTVESDIWTISNGIIIEGQIRIIFGEFFLNKEQRQFIIMSLLKMKHA